MIKADCGTYSPYYTGARGECGISENEFKIGGCDSPGVQSENTTIGNTDLVTDREIAAGECVENRSREGLTQMRLVRVESAGGEGGIRTHEGR